MTYVRMDTIFFFFVTTRKCIYVYIGYVGGAKKKSNQIHLFQFWRWRLRFLSVRPHKSVVKSFSRTSFAAMNGRQLNTHSRRRRHHIFSQWDITLECQNGEWYTIYTYTIYYLNIYIYMFLLCVCFNQSVVFFFSRLNPYHSIPHIMYNIPLYTAGRSAASRNSFHFKIQILWLVPYK